MHSFILELLFFINDPYIIIIDVRVVVSTKFDIEKFIGKNNFNL